MYFFFKLIIVFSLHSFTYSLIDHVTHEYCIIGAGPAGLQLGYFLSKADRDYIIFEKSNNSGKWSTFKSYDFKVYDSFILKKVLFSIIIHAIVN